jgi:hypothetical protein
MAGFGRLWQALADFGGPAGEDELILALLSRFAGNHQGSEEVRLRGRVD